MPPEFFADRSLGRVTVERLRTEGWAIHRISEVYPDDARHVPDEDWISHGCRRGWTLLTKDKRIRYRAPEIGSLDGATLLFCLANQQLSTDQMVAALATARGRIHRAIDRGDAGFWHVYLDGSIKRMWP